MRVGITPSGTAFNEQDVFHIRSFLRFEFSKSLPKPCPLFPILPNTILLVQPCLFGIVGATYPAGEKICEILRKIQKAMLRCLTERVQDVEPIPAVSRIDTSVISRAALLPRRENTLNGLKQLRRVEWLFQECNRALAETLRPHVGAAKSSQYDYWQIRRALAE
jgi:hypothetical protein